MSRLRIVFMGTPDFAVPSLTALIDGGYDVKTVVTQPDRPKGRGQRLAASPVKEAALSYKLPILQPNKIKDDEFLQKITDLKPDVLVVVAFGQLLSPGLLNMPLLGCINVHASLLPKYRGAAPVHWAVINGDSSSGVTTMYMDNGLDTGDMILKAETPVDSEMTAGILHDKLKILGAKILIDTLRQIEKGQVPRQTQNEVLATYAPKLTRELEKIDWQKPAPCIHNLVRGLNPWPLAYSSYRDKPLKICLTRLHSLKGESCQPGRVAGLTKDGFLVETGQGVLEVLKVQPAAKRCMRADEYARGYFLNVGEILN